MGTLFREISRRHFSYRAEQSDVAERINVIEALQARGDARILLSEGMRLLCDEAADVRLRAAKAIASIGTREAAEAITHAWEDFGADGLSAAVEALAGLGREAVYVLRRQLEHGKADVRAAAAEALGRIDGKTIVTDLATALADRNVNVVCAAARALGHQGAAQCIDDLAVVYRRIPEARPAVLEALGRIGTPPALALIRSALEANDEPTREAARRALADLEEAT